MITGNDLTALIDAIQGPPGDNGPNPTGTHPLSYAMYDIAHAISDHTSAQDHHQLGQDIREAAEIIHDGLLAVACAIRATVPDDA